MKFINTKLIFKFYKILVILSIIKKIYFKSKLIKKYLNIYQNFQIFVNILIYILI